MSERARRDPPPTWLDLLLDRLGYLRHGGTYAGRVVLPPRQLTHFRAWVDSGPALGKPSLSSWVAQRILREYQKQATLREQIARERERGAYR